MPGCARPTPAWAQRRAPRAHLDGACLLHDETLRDGSLAGADPPGPGLRGCVQTRISREPPCRGGCACVSRGGAACGPTQPRAQRGALLRGMPALAGADGSIACRTSGGPMGLGVAGAGEELSIPGALGWPGWMCGWRFPPRSRRPLCLGRDAWPQSPPPAPARAYHSGRGKLPLRCASALSPGWVPRTRMNRDTWLALIHMRCPQHRRQTGRIPTAFGPGTDPRPTLRLGAPTPPPPARTSAWPRCPPRHPGSRSRQSGRSGKAARLPPTSGLDLAPDPFGLTIDPNPVCTCAAGLGWPASRWSPMSGSCPDAWRFASGCWR